MKKLLLILFISLGLIGLTNADEGKYTMEISKSLTWVLNTQNGDIKYCKNFNKVIVDCSSWRRNDKNQNGKTGKYIMSYDSNRGVVWVINTQNGDIRSCYQTGSPMIECSSWTKNDENKTFKE
ncbi:hypothetical protein N8477_05075 [Candidatus Thioglobus sp.]|nr:hypothetical protein [Candidatus Thioglobus sp.]